METVTLEQVNKNVLKLHDEIVELKKKLKEFGDVDLDVRPEYVDKLRKIQKGKFVSREAFEKELDE